VRVSINAFSVSKSRELVGSSRINKVGLEKSALAIPILCACPPLKLLVKPSILKSSFPVSYSTKLDAFALRKASHICVSVIVDESRPSATFSRTVPGKRKVS